MITEETEELFAHIDSGVFIERYTDRFTRGIEVDDVTVHEFDRMVFAKGENEDVPEEIIWGAAGGFSRHIGLLPNADPKSIRDVRTYLRQLNMQPTKQTAEAFYSYLQENFSSITTLSHSALVEIPDPKAPKVGKYPVVNVILYGHPDGTVRKSVEATLHGTGFAVDEPESVFTHIDQKTSTGDVRTYADTVYRDTLAEFRDKLTENVVSELDGSTLESAGYTNLKEEDVPQSANRIHAGKGASYWQKEIWKVDGIDATTGFSRIWFITDEKRGIVHPSAGDFDINFAVQQIKEELQT